MTEQSPKDILILMQKRRHIALLQKLKDGKALNSQELSELRFFGRANGKNSPSREARKMVLFNTDWKRSAAIISITVGITAVGWYGLTGA
jgi:hypothetical protein